MFEGLFFFAFAMFLIVILLVWNKKPIVVPRQTVSNDLSLFPKTGHRWIAEVLGLDSILMLSITRPAFDCVGGSLSWQPIFMEMHDAVGVNTSQELISWSKSCEPRDVIIKHLNLDGSINETWTLCNAVVDSVNFGSLSYESVESLRIIVELNYEDVKVEYSATPVQ